MATRRKKQYLVAGMMALFSGMACVLPLPTREPGTVPNDATPQAVQYVPAGIGARPSLGNLTVVELPASPDGE